MVDQDDTAVRDYFDDLAAMRDEDLHPDLVPWLEPGPFGQMLRHPLVYDLTVSTTPGMANRIYAQKKVRLARAIEEQDWHSVVFLHERAYRFKAMVDYCTGRDMDDFIVPLQLVPEHTELVVSVWVDSENIEQEQDGWRALLRNGAGLWLGDDDDREAFDNLPDPIPAWRGGIVGDWSWTIDPQVAQFFSRRSKYPARHTLIPKADVFGYITDRRESELLVRLTDERRPLVYPHEQS